MNWLGRSLPPLSTLLPFEAAARLESFSRAADELHLTQAAISRQVRALEEDLGQALFERRNRGVFLTPEGREFAHIVSRSLGNMADQANDLRGPSHGAQVILFCQLCEAFYWLMPRLASFNRRYPDIDLKLATSTRPLTEYPDPFDIALQTNGRPSGNHHLAFTASDEIYPICSPDHPAAVKAPLSLASLAGAELLHHRVEPPDWIEWADWFRAMEHPLTAPLPGKTFDSYPLMLQATLEGHGVALGWRRTAERLIASDELVRPVRESLYQPEAIAVYTRHRSSERYATRALLGWLEETLNGTPT
ncbi:MULTISPECIES: LysR substrate-binding domain-containing protein [Halomonadaceae]|uniref:LysR substrate-binding domain-containing protein n=1 Tax=Halomonadaceae TaxID=28256 RepID=UPI0015831872|nr:MULTISPECIES: LysR substrate-binding domain-containing protein [Halomonas]MDI4636371.1 LysR substrate-binding domain-containing protein [Halomonas sp. BMC7]NUJ60735.1 LysR family transcriptional regulator [Halomonas taeanensis]